MRTESNEGFPIVACRIRPEPFEALDMGAQCATDRRVREHHVLGCHGLDDRRRILLSWGDDDRCRIGESAPGGSAPGKYTKMPSVVATTAAAPTKNLEVIVFI
jgi:hypothetical protein